MVVVRNVGQVGLRIDHVFHREACRLDHGLDVLQTLAELAIERRGHLAVRATCALSRNIQVFTHQDAGAVRANRFDARGKDGALFGAVRVNEAGQKKTEEQNRGSPHEVSSMYVFGIPSISRRWWPLLARARIRRLR